MASIETKFYVARGYYARKTNMLGDGVVFGSFRDDTQAGKASADGLRKELQEANDKEREAIKPKQKRKS